MDDCIKGEEGGRGDDARWCRTFFFLLIWVAMADGEEEALAAAAGSERLGFCGSETGGGWRR
jgi:hypothetical protein